MDRSRVRGEFSPSAGNEADEDRGDEKDEGGRDEAADFANEAVADDANDVEDAFASEVPPVPAPSPSGSRTSGKSHGKPHLRTRTWLATTGTYLWLLVWGWGAAPPHLRSTGFPRTLGLLTSTNPAFCEDLSPLTMVRPPTAAASLARLASNRPPPVSSVLLLTLPRSAFLPPRATGGAKISGGCCSTPGRSSLSLFRPNSLVSRGVVMYMSLLRAADTRALSVPGSRC